jgi:hypothetical protein
MNDVKEVFVQVRSPKGGGLDGVSLRMFPNLKRTHEYKNFPLHKPLSFYFFAFFLIL